MIRTALVRNHDLRDAVVRVEAARANLGITRADQFPTIDAGASVTTARTSRAERFPLPEGFDQTRTFGTVGAQPPLVRSRCLGPAAPRHRSRTGRPARQRGEPQGGRHDAGERRRERLLQPARAGHGAGDRQAHAGGPPGLVGADHEAGRRADSERFWRFGRASSWSTAPRRSSRTLEQLIEQTENQISLLLGGSPGAIVAGSSVDRTGAAAVGPGRIAVGAARSAPGHSGAEQNLVAANAIIGVAKAAYFPRISLTGLLGSQSDQLSQPLHRSDEGVAVRAAGHAADLQRRPPAIECAAGQGAGTARAHRVRAGDSERRSAKCRIRSCSIRRCGRSARNRSCWSQRCRIDRECPTCDIEGGIDTLLNALDADRDLFEAELGLAQTRRNELLALVQLYRALGGGWQQ